MTFIRDYYAERRTVRGRVMEKHGAVLIVNRSMLLVRDVQFGLALGV